MTWKLPFTALGYRFPPPPSFGFVFREKRPSCKHVEDSSKLQQPKKQKRKEKKRRGKCWTPCLFSFDQKAQPKVLDPRNTSLTLCFSTLSPRYLSIIPLSPPSPHLQTLFHKMKKNNLKRGNVITTEKKKKGEKQNG